jgi:hypothetical protein
MKARHRKSRAKRGSADQASKRTSRPLAHDSEPLAYGSKPRRNTKHLGKVHGSAPVSRADRKPRRIGRPPKQFGGGLPPAANDNEDVGLRLENMRKDWRAGSYPAWRKDIANNNTLLPLPGGKK